MNTVVALRESSSGAHSGEVSATGCLADLIASRRPPCIAPSVRGQGARKLLEDNGLPSTPTPNRYRDLRLTPPICGPAKPASRRTIAGAGLPEQFSPAGATAGHLRV